MAEKDEILKLAKLSKLTLSEDEINEFTADMQAVIAFADMVSKADLYNESDILCNNILPLREDFENSSYPKEDILQNAPSVEDGYFKLPKKK